jgi:hypothetical protein
MRPRKHVAEQTPVVIEEIDDEPDAPPEYYEEQERHNRHIACLNDFGYLVESPVADQQEAWLKSREDLRKAQRHTNEDKKVMYMRYRQKCLDCMANCAVAGSLAKAKKQSVAEYYRKNTPWPEEWAKERAYAPNNYTVVPSQQTIEDRLLHGLEQRLNRQLYRRRLRHKHRQ